MLAEITVDHKIEQITAEYEAHELQNLDEKLAIIKAQLKAIHDLNKAGLTSRKPSYYNTEYVSIRVNKNRLTDVRRILNCPLRKVRTDVDDNNQLEIHLEPTNHPNMRIIYTTDLPENSRCRIEPEHITIKRLVCSR